MDKKTVFRSGVAVMIVMLVTRFMGGNANGVENSTEIPDVSSRTLIAWSESDIAEFRLSDATLEPVAGTDRVRIQMGTTAAWPGVTYQFAGGPNSGLSAAPVWNLDNFAEISFDVRNLGNTEQTLNFRVDDDIRADGAQHCMTRSVLVPPGETRRLSVPLQRKMASELAAKFIGMRGMPAEFGQSDGLDLTHICGVVLFVNQPSQSTVFEIGPVMASGTQPKKVNETATKEIFPLVDETGQYRHRDWPGKLGLTTEFPERIAAEVADLAVRPGAAERDVWGGWLGGPQLTATGFFRVEKVNGAWWFVDPDGWLFWSHGTDCVGTGNGVTPTTNREHYFTNLPGRDDPVFGKFCGTAGRSPVGHYKDFDRYETYNFTESNLFRKYGGEWRGIHAALAHYRLRSWGMNTIGNWSDRRIYMGDQINTDSLSGPIVDALKGEIRRTPYVATVGGNSPPIRGSEGYWGKFPDPFDPEFRKSIARSMENIHETVGDPWCIGYFVHNELSWGGNEYELAEATLLSPANQPAKLAFVDDLKRKYTTIDALNTAWGTLHKSWESLLDATKKPDRKKASSDLVAFSNRVAETYFAGCRDMVKAAAPDQLYLGCRFAWGYELATRAAAKYCDVLSFNRYERSLSGFQLPDGIDQPVIIGEFHFGALDRGMFHTGLVPTRDQADRATHYRNYVESALRHPMIVGTHWFQYGDQATTGRFDGENYQIGLLDITDTPYPELIEATRAIGEEMYELRSRILGNSE